MGNHDTSPPLSFPLILAQHILIIYFMCIVHFLTYTPLPHKKNHSQISGGLKSGMPCLRVGDRNPACTFLSWWPWVNLVPGMNLARPVHRMCFIPSLPVPAPAEAGAAAMWAPVQLQQNPTLYPPAATFFPQDKNLKKQAIRLTF